MSQKGENTIQAFWVLVGSISAFGFTLVSTVLLSRYFNKQDYGTYRQIIYVYNTLLVVFTLGLPKAYSYFLPKVGKEHAKDVINKLNNILLILGALMSIIFFLGADMFANLLKNSDLATPIRYFSLVPLFLLPTMGLEGILATYKQTKFLAIYTTLSKLFTLLCVIVPVVLLNKGINAAVIGFTFASFLCFIMALYLKDRPVRQYEKLESNIKYKEIFAFAIPLLKAGVWGIIISSADQFFVSRYFGNKVFADFANGSLELPFVSMVIASTATVLSPIFARIGNEGGISKQEAFSTWSNVFEKSAKLIYPMIIYTWVFADVIFITLYGGKYADASSFFRIKCIINFFTLIAYAPLIINIGKVKYYANVHMYGAIILLIAEYISVKLFNSPYALTAISVLCQFGRIYFMLKLVAKYFNKSIIQLFPLKLIIRIVIPSVFILSLEHYLLVTIFSISGLMALIISLTIYIVVYLIYSVIVKLDYSSIYKPIFAKLKL